MDELDPRHHIVELQRRNTQSKAEDEKIKTMLDGTKKGPFTKKECQALFARLKGNLDMKVLPVSCWLHAEEHLESQLLDWDRRDASLKRRLTQHAEQHIYDA